MANLGSPVALVGSCWAPACSPRRGQTPQDPLQKVVFVNLNRNLTGQLGTYCKLTKPMWAIFRSQAALGTLLLVLAMAPSGEKVKITKPRWLKRGYYFVKCRPFRSRDGIQYHDLRPKRAWARGRGWGNQLPKVVRQASPQGPA